jgi:hypothetical protein
MSEQDSSAVQKKGISVSCHVCNLAANTFCGNCNDVAYCSRECQLKDWKTGSHGGTPHKKECKELALWKKESDECIGIKRFPKALWCNYRGKDTFTGIVLVNEDWDTRKLDDPNGELDGPSHVMGGDEYLSEMCHYDGKEGRPSKKIRDKVKSVNLIDFFMGLMRDPVQTFLTLKMKNLISSIPMACQEVGFIVGRMVISNKFDPVIKLE